MSMTELIPADSDIEVVRVDQGTISAITRSEIESQLDAAHKYKRSIKRFLDDATALVTFSEDIAKSCIYSLPRGKDESGNKKVITGPSVRLAEMALSAYGNMHVGARVIGAEEKEVVSQGVAWDLEKNIRVTIEKRRRITDKHGKRFNDDMITVTGNAAASIALRDAIFRVIPKAYVNAIYEAARRVAVGDASTLIEKRTRMFEGFLKMGVMRERVLARLERVGPEDVSLTDIETLIGLANAIKDGSATIDEAFPQPQSIPPSNGKTAIERIVEQSKKPEQKPEPVPAPAVTLGDFCTQDDFRDIETAAGDSKIKMPDVYQHIMATMGYRPAESLPKNRKVEVLNWLAAHKR